MRISPVVLDALIHLPNTGGGHPILFGGMWSKAAQAVIDKINYLALKYDVDTAYNFKANSGAGARKHPVAAAMEIGCTF